MKAHAIFLFRQHPLYINIFIDRFLNVLGKNDRFMIVRLIKNIIQEWENGNQKKHAYTDYGYFSCKHRRS